MVDLLDFNLCKMKYAFGLNFGFDKRTFVHCCFE